MKYDSARELKHLWAARLSATGPGGARAMGLARRAMAVELAATTAVSSVALGVSHRGGDESNFQLAVRVQRRSLEASGLLEEIRASAQGEVDVRYVGAIRKRQLPWQQTGLRPLLIGGTIAHYAVTAGTLGCFVRLRSEPAGPLHLLSNNHVLANENRASIGDAILQPANDDNGQLPADIVASLASYVPLVSDATNFVDAAIAEISANVGSDRSVLRDWPANLAGISTEPLYTGMAVAKSGRTTFLTRGMITATDLDNVVVDFDAPLGSVKFNDQIEIEGVGNKSFSEGGDSGALVWKEDHRTVIGLLFSGSDQGGANGKGLTYANPIQRVLDDLKVDLAL